MELAQSDPKLAVRIIEVQRDIDARRAEQQVETDPAKAPEPEQPPRSDYDLCHQRDVSACVRLAGSDTPAGMEAAVLACELGHRESCDSLAARIPNPDGHVVTELDYLLVAEGYRLSTVEAIIGSPGTEVYGARTGGVVLDCPGLYVRCRADPELEAGIVVYRWENRDGSLLEATFQNGRLAAKTQAGLP